MMVERPGGVIAPPGDARPQQPLSDDRRYSPAAASTLLAPSDDAISLSIQVLAGQGAPPLGTGTQIPQVATKEVVALVVEAG